MGTILGLFIYGFGGLFVYWIARKAYKNCDLLKIDKATFLQKSDEALNTLFQEKIPNAVKQGIHKAAEVTKKTMEVDHENYKLRNYSS